MSFGFGVGDFIAVGELCWKIYTRVYKVSRDAPEELRALIQELGNLSNTMTLLNEEFRDTEEWVKRAGERRLEYTCKVMRQAKETLQKMDRLANKYAELGMGDSSEGSRRSFRIQWNRIKYALEVSSINELRSKFMSHNFQLTLLLQGAQNSSLERIEKQQTQTDIKLEELRNVMISERSSRESPLLNAPLDTEVRAELSAAFLRSAETGNRPWATIGIDDWLQAGKWWLLKIAKISLETFPSFDFQLHDVEGCTMNIWLQAPPSSTIAPRRQFSINRDRPSWQTSDGEVLFQCFAEIYSTNDNAETTENTENTANECFLMLEVPQQGIYLNAILQNFAGQDICKLKVETPKASLYPRSTVPDGWGMLKHRIEKLGSAVRLLNDQDTNALNAIIEGFQLFRSAFQPASLSVSMVHSVSVLVNWPSPYFTSLLLPGYDIGFPARSDQLALLLRNIIDALIKKGYQDKIPTSEFLAKDCLKVQLPLEAFTWKLICWHCEKFADMKHLLEGLNTEEPPRDSLIQSAFLRLDRDFLSQLMQYIKHEDGWHPHDILIMVEAALSSDDVGYLLWILERVAASVISEHQTRIFQLVYSSRRLRHIDAMIQVVVPRPVDIAVTLAWYLDSSDEQRFRDFLHMVEGRGGSFRGKPADEVDFTNFYPAFVAGCSRLIEIQSSNSLSLYLDSLEELGIDFHRIKARESTESSQLAVLPALVSPDPSFLRILLEREVVVAVMQPFVVEYESWKYEGIERKISFRELVQYPPPPMPHWPLYCAVVLACDTEFLQLLGQHGASLQQESRVNEDQASKAQGIVDHLSRLLSLEDARLEHMEALMFCHILIHVGIKGGHYRIFGFNKWKATEKTTDYRETWSCMERLLYRDGFFLSCSNPCDFAFRGEWKRQPDKRSKLMSRYSELPNHYPKHLQTQSNWDIWRQDALQILRKLI
ncbi:hypothetical protein BKA60DRAFT_624307 [Fusarium oxysporum]|nr:hypothetical protein BKA60DRAFT_624307 [Fusarium oxysporum]